MEEELEGALQQGSAGDCAVCLAVARERLARVELGGAPVGEVAKVSDLLRRVDRSMVLGILVVVEPSFEPGLFVYVKVEVGVVHCQAVAWVEGIHARISV